MLPSSSFDPLTCSPPCRLHPRLAFLSSFRGSDIIVMIYCRLHVINFLSSSSFCSPRPNSRSFPLLLNTSESRRLQCHCSLSSAIHFLPVVVSCQLSLNADTPSASSLLSLRPMMHIRTYRDIFRRHSQHRFHPLLPYKIHGRCIAPLTFPPFPFLRSFLLCTFLALSFRRRLLPLMGMRVGYLL